METCDSFKKKTQIVTMKPCTSISEERAELVKGTAGGRAAPETVAHHELQVQHEGGWCCFDCLPLLGGCWHGFW